MTDTVFATDQPARTLSERGALLTTLLGAVKIHRCHVLITPPSGAYGFEVSLSPETDGDAMYHGQHPTDPEAALAAALNAYLHEDPSDG